MSHPTWFLLHPGMTPEHLGPYFPFFLVNEDPRKAAEQFNERYQYGGWNPHGQDKYHLSPNYTLTYPGDPPLRPIAMAKLRDETILLYQSDIVVIVQPDRSFEVCRMD